MRINVDIQTAQIIEGWCADVDNPEKKFSVRLVSANRTLSGDYATRFRPDLMRSGYADGNFGFRLEVPSGCGSVKIEATEIKASQRDYTDDLEELSSPADSAYVYFSPVEFFPRIQRPQHLAMEAAKAGYMSIYISPVAKLGGELRYIGEPDPVVHLNLDSSKVVDFYLNRQSPKLMADELHRVMTILAKKFRRIHFVTAFPINDLTLPENCRLIFDYIDDYQVTAPYEVRMDDILDLLHSADIVSITSEKLPYLERVTTDKMRLVPNGFDGDVFKITKELPLTLPRPIDVLYVGALDHYNDVDYIIDVARLNPNLEVRVAGSGCRSWKISQATKKYQNIRYMGEVRKSEAYRLIKLAKIGLISFSSARVAEWVNPIKMYEYFAGGAGCVSNFPISAPAKTLAAIAIAPDPENFASRINEARSGIASLGDIHAILAGFNWRDLFKVHVGDTK